MQKRQTDDVKSVQSVDTGDLPETYTVMPSSSEVTFKLKTSKHRKRSDTKKFEPTPILHSTTIAPNVVPSEFDDTCVQMVHDLLREHHPDIAGLQFVGLGSYKDKTMPLFSAAGERIFVQIINSDGDHWICVTNIFGENS